MTNIIFGTLVLATLLWLPERTYSQANQSLSKDSVVYRDLPYSSKGKLKFFLDTGSFRGAEGFCLQEIYIVLDAKQIQFVPEGRQYVGQVDFTVKIVNLEGGEVASESWTRNLTVESLKALQKTGTPVREIIGFNLRPGIYRLMVVVEDIYGDKQGVCEAVLGEHFFENGPLAISEILFSLSLKPAEGNGRFVKQGWHVLPNTTRGFSIGNPLYIFYEIYNLKVKPYQDKDAFVVGYNLTDSSGISIKSYPSQLLLKPGESVVKVDSLDTEGMEEGLYFLQVDVFDRTYREHVRTRRQLYLMSDNQKETEVTEKDKMLLRHYSDIRWVSEGSDQKLFENLNSQSSKDKFLRLFWKKMDPTPKTVTNERLIQHLNRIKYAENSFTSFPGQRGSDTDKGRIYIKYGPPDDTELTTTATGQKPIEKWIYERQGRYMFLFQDRRGQGVFDLVHSTYPGELFNPNWEQEF